MGIVFDGKVFAASKEEQVKRSLKEWFRIHGRLPQLVTIVNPRNQAGMKYTMIKMVMADGLGVKMVMKETENPDEASKYIDEVNKNAEVDGVMVQLPFGDKETDKKLCEMIAVEKDVDGLRTESKFVPATVRAVKEILAEADKSIQGNLGQIMIVGNKGEVGKRLMKELPEAIGMDKDDWKPERLSEAGVVIAATGQAGLIRPEMIKNNAVCIDVGYPQGDFMEEVKEKAGFFTPVPGGVGPVTVVMLFANLVEKPNK